MSSGTPELIKWGKPVSVNDIVGLRWWLRNPLISNGIGWLWDATAKLTNKYVFGQLATKVCFLSRVLTGVWPNSMNSSLSMPFNVLHLAQNIADSLYNLSLWCVSCLIDCSIQHEQETSTAIVVVVVFVAVSVMLPQSSYIWLLNYSYSHIC